MEQAEATTPPLEEGPAPDRPAPADDSLKADSKDLEKVKHFAAVLQKHLMRNGQMQLLLPDLVLATPVTSFGADLWQPVTFKVLERVRQPCSPNTKALVSRPHQRRELVPWPRRRAFLYKGDSLAGSQSHPADLVLFMPRVSSSQQLFKAWMLRLKALGHVNPWLPFLMGSVAQGQQLGHVRLVASGSELQQGTPSSSRALSRFSHRDRDPLEPILTYRRKLKRRTLFML